MAYQRTRDGCNWLSADYRVQVTAIRGQMSTEPAAATGQQEKRKEVLEKAANDANMLIEAYISQDTQLDQAK